jgi:hypothetical protein
VIHVAHRGEIRCAQKLWSGNLKGRDHFQDLSINGRIILKCILNMLRRSGLDSSGMGYEPVVGSCEYGNEALGC